MFTPAYLDDIFTIPESIMTEFTKGFAAFSLSHIILDQTIDRQLPADPTAPLVQQQLVLDIFRYWQPVIPPPHNFWDDFFHFMNRHHQALALESYCLDARKQRYDLETMREATKGKALTFCVAVHLMGCLSSNTEPMTILDKVFEEIVFADQLFDDTSDWEEDFKNQRCTFPLLTALEAAGLTIDSFETISFEDMADWIERYHVIARMYDQTVHILEDCQSTLLEAGFTETQLQSVVEERLQYAQRQRRYQYAGAFLKNIAARLGR
jgi:hypothetical protein